MRQSVACSNPWGLLSAICWQSTFECWHNACMSQLSDPKYIVIKAGLATALALGLDTLLGNPDHVSSTFVAVLCTSPTILMGLRNVRAQLVGSLIGGAWGTLAALAGLPKHIGLPLAVALAVATAFRTGVGTAYPIAAFTALFVLLVPRGTPLDTIETRFLAIFIAGVSSFLINVVISGGRYPRIFAKRLQRAEGNVMRILPEVIQGNTTAADQAFAQLAELQQQLGQTLEELQLRRATQMATQIAAMRLRVQDLTYLLHLVWDMAHLQREIRILVDDTEPLIYWLQVPEGIPPGVPEELRDIQHRLVSVRKRLLVAQGVDGIQ